MKRSAFLCLLFLVPLAIQAAETPETVLIRRALDGDKFGRRRGDADLVLSTFAEYFVVYDAQSSPDPRRWKVRHAGRDAAAAAIRTDLKAYRYDIERLVPFIQVRGAKAIATTVDSGRVIDRSSNEARPYTRRQLWMFTKVEDRWLATAFADDLADDLAESSASAAPTTPEPAVAAVLIEDAKAWNNGSNGRIIGGIDEDFIGYDAGGHLAPAQWVILFSGSQEWEAWVNKRLEATSYDLDRQVLFAHQGSQGREALAVSRDRVTTRHDSGPAVHELERYVLWTLSRRSGSWKVTNMLYNLGLED